MLRWTQYTLYVILVRRPGASVNQSLNSTYLPTGRAWTMEAPGNGGRGRQFGFPAWINPKTTSRDHFGQALSSPWPSQQPTASNRVGPRTRASHLRHARCRDEAALLCLVVLQGYLGHQHASTYGGQANLHAAGWLVVGNRLKQCGGVQR